MTAAEYTEKLLAQRSDEERQKYARYFKSGIGEIGGDDYFTGVRMGAVFELAKAYVDMPVGELEKLLESPIHEVRAGGVSIMDKDARRKKTGQSRLKELCDLYLRRTDRINDWDLVDLGAPYVVGRYLSDNPRGVLYELARSSNLWERRIAIVSTAYFTMQGDLDDTFNIAESLVGDPEELVQKAVGGWLRAAGDKDEARLRAFLDRHAAIMPRIALRYALEHLDPGQRKHYIALKDR
jgi:hypothetical protein